MLIGRSDRRGKLVGRHRDHLARCTATNGGRLKYQTYQVWLVLALIFANNMQDALRILVFWDARVEPLWPRQGKGCSLMR